MCSFNYYLLRFGSAVVKVCLYVVTVKGQQRAL